MYLDRRSSRQESTSSKNHPHPEYLMEKALLAMLTKTVREIERQKPGTIELLRNALDVIEAEREASRKDDDRRHGDSPSTELE